MQPVFLIAWNFVRTQWLVVTVMSAYLLSMTGLFSFHLQFAETALFLQWHSLYVFFLAMTLAVSAIQGERKSRRIVAVLSKGIHRCQYLAGLLCGCAIIVGIFWVLIAGSMLVLVRQAGHPVGGLSLIVLALFCCCLAASSVSLFYSVFLHPLLASGASAVTLLLPFILQTAGLPAAGEMFPLFGAANLLLRFQLNAVREASTIALVAVVWVIVFVAAGTLAFNRRDVTISPE
jgi:ABC-type transport system involved in multi-copper enzyme maturation permease subunit